MKVLLDMDGVIVDFATSCCRLFGFDLRELVASGKWVAGEWNMFKAWGMSASDFYRLLGEAGAAFWLQLAPYHWARELYGWLQSWCQVYFCTAPIKHPECAAAKIRWLEEFTGKRGFDEYVITGHKELMARGDTLLIDDRDKNVSLFRAAGGHAILFPAHWNTRHGEKEQAVSILKKEFRQLADESGLRLLSEVG